MIRIDEKTTADEKRICPCSRTVYFGWRYASENTVVGPMTKHELGAGEKACPAFRDMDTEKFRAYVIKNGLAA